MKYRECRGPRPDFVAHLGGRAVAKLVCLVCGRLITEGAGVYFTDSGTVHVGCETCERCSKPIQLKESTAFRNGNLYHLRCWSERTQLRSLDLVDRAKQELSANERLLNEMKEHRAT
jgi:hypothetical protein